MYSYDTDYGSKIFPVQVPRSYSVYIYISYIYIYISYIYIDQKNKINIYIHTYIYIYILYTRTPYGYVIWTLGVIQDQGKLVHPDGKPVDFVPGLTWLRVSSNAEFRWAASFLLSDTGSSFSNHRVKVFVSGPLNYQPSRGVEGSLVTSVGCHL